MVSFTSTLLSALAIVGAFALPTELAERDGDLVSRSVAPGQGTSGGYFYQFWTQGGGSVTYNNGNAGQYSVSWSNIQDFTAGKGWAVGAARAITYSANFNPGANGYLSVYTWTTTHETYIVENFGGYNPSSAATHMGTVSTDGSTYNIYKDSPGANFVQYWSVRVNKRSSGTVTTANHYNAWAKLGMTFNVASGYQILSTEGFGSSGSSTVTVS